MKKKQKTDERIRQRFDTELAITNDILDLANRLAIHSGWRVALRTLYYVAMRISSDRGRKVLVEFLSDQNVGW